MSSSPSFSSSLAESSTPKAGGGSSTSKHSDCNTPGRSIPFAFTSKNDPAPATSTAASASPSPNVTTGSSTVTPKMSQRQRQRKRQLFPIFASSSTSRPQAKPLRTVTASTPTIVIDLIDSDDENEREVAKENINGSDNNHEIKGTRSENKKRSTVIDLQGDTETINTATGVSMSVSNDTVATPQISQRLRNKILERRQRKRISRRQQRQQDLQQQLLVGEKATATDTPKDLPKVLSGSVRSTVQAQNSTGLKKSTVVIDLLNSDDDNSDGEGNMKKKTMKGEDIMDLSPCLLKRSERIWPNDCDGDDDNNNSEGNKKKKKVIKGENMADLGPSLLKRFKRISPKPISTPSQLITRSRSGLRSQSQSQLQLPRPPPPQIVATRVAGHCGPVSSAKKTPSKSTSPIEQERQTRRACRKRKMIDPLDRCNGGDDDNKQQQKQDCLNNIQINHERTEQAVVTESTTIKTDELEPLMPCPVLSPPPPLVPSKEPLNVMQESIVPVFHFPWEVHENVHDEQDESPLPHCDRTYNDDGKSVPTALAYNELSLTSVPMPCTKTFSIANQNISGNVSSMLSIFQTSQMDEEKGESEDSGSIHHDLGGFDHYDSDEEDNSFQNDFIQSDFRLYRSRDMHSNLVHTCSTAFCSTQIPMMGAQCLELMGYNRRIPSLELCQDLVRCLLKLPDLRMKARPPTTFDTDITLKRNVETQKIPCISFISSPDTKNIGASQKKSSWTVECERVSLVTSYIEHIFEVSHDKVDDAEKKGLQSRFVKAAIAIRFFDIALDQLDESLSNLLETQSCIASECSKKTDIAMDTSDVRKCSSDFFTRSTRSILVFHTNAIRVLCKLLIVDYELNEIECEGGVHSAKLKPKEGKQTRLTSDHNNYSCMHENHCFSDMKALEKVVQVWNKTFVILGHHLWVGSPWTGYVSELTIHLGSVTKHLLLSYVRMRKRREDRLCGSKIDFWILPSQSRGIVDRRLHSEIISIFHRLGHSKKKDVYRREADVNFQRKNWYLIESLQHEGLEKLLRKSLHRLF